MASEGVFTPTEALEIVIQGRNVAALYPHFKEDGSIRAGSHRINFTTTLFDVGIGAATAGVFHKAEKLFKKASPWVKKGASKVNDAIENANNKFKNMSDNFSSRFGNKLAFEGIGGFNGNSPINNVKLKPTRTQIAYNEAIKETKEAAENQMKKATSKGVGEATVPKRPGGYRYI